MSEVRWAPDSPVSAAGPVALRVPLSGLWRWTPLAVFLFVALLLFASRGCMSSWESIDDFGALEPSSAIVLFLTTWAVAAVLVLWRFLRFLMSRGQFVGFGETGLWLGGQRRGTFIPWEELLAVEGRRLDQPLSAFRRVASRQRVVFCVDQSFTDRADFHLPPAFRALKPNGKSPDDWTRISVNCSLLALDPVILVTLARFYQQVPKARGELANVFALDRFRGRYDQAA